MKRRILLGCLLVSSLSMSCGGSSDDGRSPASNPPSAVPSPVATSDVGNGGSSLTPVPFGEWGNPSYTTTSRSGISLVVRNDGAEVHVCVPGEIDEPLLMDSNGKFSAKGSINDPCTPFRHHPATFTGSVQGTVMQMHISYVDPTGANREDDYTLYEGVTGSGRCGFACPTVAPSPTPTPTPSLTP